LALEDVIALVTALDNEPHDLREALEAYEATRRPVAETLVKAAKTSASWYEHFPEHMKLAPLDFGYSYITRSGRIDDSQLRAMSPRFMERYDAHSSNLKKIAS
jgi:2-polyprenyl-6-methoxyphenol hydroxylase-like FAD-dependent oxidoreductase